MTLNPLNSGCYAAYHTDMRKQSANIKRDAWYSYTGTEHPYLRYVPVKAIRPIMGDDDQPTARYEVAPWIDAERRVSWVTSDPRLADLRPWPAGQSLPVEP